MLQGLREQVQGPVAAGARPLRQWVGPIPLTVAVGVGYFLAARSSLHLVTASGVAAFWPAAGVALGTLIALGRDARWPVAVGVIATDIVANLMGDRSIWSAIWFSLCHAGEALLAGWMIERYIGSEFSLGRLRHVLGLLAATAVGTAVSGVGGTMGHKLVHGPNASAWITWLQWLASDSIGIITVAPLIIGLVAALRAPPPRRELIEGAVAVAAVVAVTAFVIFLMPKDWWDARAAIVLLFPLLLWPAVRCRPVFASAASFAVCLMFVMAITFDAGNFNGASSSSALILGGQVRIFGMALFALLLASLFDERRQHEAVVVDRETRLQEALAAGSVMAFEWDAATDLVRRSNNAAQVLGIDPQLLPTAASFLARIDPDDRARLKAARSNMRHDNPTCSVAFRFKHPGGQEIWFQETSKADFDAAGRLVRIRGLAADITERKRAGERDALLRLAQASTGVGVWTLDVRTRELNVSPELEELFGLEPGSMKRYADFRDRVHPDDIVDVEAYRAAQIPKGKNFWQEFRIVHPNGATRWLRANVRVEYDAITGKPIRIFGNDMDITERKRAEDRQKMLIAELDHRVKNTLALVMVVGENTRRGSKSVDEFVRSHNERIQSMAVAHTLLSKSSWQDVDLDALVKGQLAPYATDANVSIGGPQVMLTATATQAVAMVLHELVTNAVKYGALSNSNGHISINWERKTNGTAVPTLRIVWRELDGPVVGAANPAGYGTSLIRNLIPHEVGGTVDLTFDSDGVCCEIEIPLTDSLPKK
jgi:PAS domain S-box-containing protein